MLSDVRIREVVNGSVEVMFIDMWAGVGIDEMDDVLMNNVSASEVVCIGIDVLVGVGVLVVMTPAVIDLEFVVSLSYAVGRLVDVRLNALAAVTTSGLGIGMLADVDVSVLAAVTTALKFIVSISLADLMPFR